MVAGEKTTKDKRKATDKAKANRKRTRYNSADNSLNSRQAYSG